MLIGAVHKDTANARYTSGLKDDANSHNSKLQKVIRILERAMTETADDGEIPKLIQTARDLEAHYVRIQDWAAKFGYNSTGDKKKRKRGAE